MYGDKILLEILNNAKDNQFIIEFDKSEISKIRKERNKLKKNKNKKYKSYKK